MFNFTKMHEKLLKTYARPIVHMRKQVAAGRFGLVFGSGLSKHFGMPKWSELVDRIAEDPRIAGSKLLSMISEKKSLPYQTELLFQHFKSQRASRSTSEKSSSKAFEFETFGEWLKIFAANLYGRAARNFQSKLKSHPYLNTYLPLVRKTLMTLNYNFDNYLERALMTTRSPSSDPGSRGYETITKPWLQFRRDNAVVYHPNGFFPPELMELPTDKFVFSEASYAEQFASVLAGDHFALLNHYCRNTCLLIGLSLQDEVLCNFLNLSSRANPGNYHYYVYFQDGKSNLNAAQREAVRRSNFSVYNLITLFLGKKEIAALGELINPDKVSEPDICEYSGMTGAQCAYRFFLSGPMGVGKSTNLNSFQNLVAFDEWLEERPDVLAKPWEELSDPERKQADAWIMGQFKKKDEALRRDKTGIFIVDRPPLDPLAFTAPKAQAKKAKVLLDRICPKEAWRVQNGKVILLTGDTDELAVRLLLTGRSGYTSDKLSKMQETMKRIYTGEGVAIVDTHGLTVREVTKRIGEIIHLQEYKPFDLHGRLEEFREGSVTA